MYYIGRYRDEKSRKWVGTVWSSIDDMLQSMFTLIEREFRSCETACGRLEVCIDPDSARMCVRHYTFVFLPPKLIRVIDHFAETDTVYKTSLVATVQSIESTAELNPFLRVAEANAAEFAHLRTTESLVSK